MNVFDYMNLVSGYIINKIENKKDFNQSMNFLIKPERDPYTNELFYEVKEIRNCSEELFYLKFPCKNKEDFYAAVRSLFIEYIKNSDLLMYSATGGEGIYPKSFSIVTKTRATVSFEIEDEQDILVFDQFKNYLDIKIKNNDDNKEYQTEELEELNENYEEVVTLSKIML